jgi:hypothetical protein
LAVSLMVVVELQTPNDNLVESSARM